jgi:hypothetical protein
MELDIKFWEEFFKHKPGLEIHELIGVLAAEGDFLVRLKEVSESGEANLKGKPRLRFLEDFTPMSCRRMQVLVAATCNLLTHDTSFVSIPDKLLLDVVLAVQQEREYFESVLQKDLLEIETDEKSLILLSLLGKFTVDTLQMVRHFYVTCRNALPSGLLEYLEVDQSPEIPEQPEHAPSEGKRGRQKRHPVRVVAKMFGVSEETVKKWDKGISPPEGYPGRDADSAFLLRCAENYKKMQSVRNTVRRLKNPVHDDWAIDNATEDVFE